MLNEIIKKRRSIRKYQQDGKVTDEQIKILLEAAMLAPSAVNSRPWEFIVIKNRKMLDLIAQNHPYAQMMKQASLAIMMTANPNALKGTKVEDLEFWQHDCGAATQNILLQATHMGLGTCWCGLPSHGERIIGFKELFNIPDDRVPFCVIAIGVPEENFGSRGFYDETKVRWFE
ncbi:MAG: nitroreductase family protein [Firmicutes bacterium]|nr:nitroreductase family protein [Bacillota bacterium]